MRIRSNDLVCMALGLALAVLTGSNVWAQQPAAPPTPARPPLVTKVDVVLSRFNGEQKVSSLPFTLWVNVPEVAEGRPVGQVGNASIRMGVDVPIGATTTSSTRTNAGEATTLSTSTTGTNTRTEYRPVGTQIDCTVTQTAQLAEGQAMVQVRVDDSSIYAPSATGRGIPRVADPMAFRTFSFSNRLPMRDGQTLQFAAGTDKISGETLRVDVSFTTIK